MLVHRAHVMLFELKLGTVLDVCAQVSVHLPGMRGEDEKRGLCTIEIISTFPRKGEK